MKSKPWVVFTAVLAAVSGGACADGPERGGVAPLTLSAAARVPAAEAQELQARFERGMALSEAGRLAEAIEVYTDITRRYPHLPEPFNNLAALHARMGDLEASKRALEAALRTHDSFATIYENLGTVYAEMARDSYVRARLLGNAPQPASLAMLADLSVEPVVELAPAAVVQAPAEPAAPVAPVPKVVAQAPAEHAAAATPSTPAALAEARVAPAAPAEVVTPEPAAVVEAAPAGDAVAASAPEVAARPVEPAPAELLPEFVADVPSAESRPSVEAEVAAVLAAWATAWSQQDHAAYLGHYDASFTPPAGAAREAWERQRQARIAAPQWIEVELVDLRVTPQGRDRARVRVEQNYRASNYRDRTLKRFDMVRTPDGWKIAAEATLRVLPQ